ncbi:hypothetical protein SCLCIDRAFT_25024 [Scleroderma citrinum Foug A]|uniref:Uncharacterized protein n=1 Tax=Scleroderma citrinum Foug A TaxID=1036808 RepID=A0A0C2ZLU1_9AGAM|nr:hypothetical protein SCLCIDRAFT_25024 [Scleroderma citrinum Foug A]
MERADGISDAAWNETLNSVFIDRRWIRRVDKVISPGRRSHTVESQIRWSQCPFRVHWLLLQYLTDGKATDRLHDRDHGSTEEGLVFPTLDACIDHLLIRARFHTVLFSVVWHLFRSHSVHLPREKRQVAPPPGLILEKAAKFPVTITSGGFIVALGPACFMLSYRLDLPIPKAVSPAFCHCMSTRTRCE